MNLLYELVVFHPNQNAFCNSLTHNRFWKLKICFNEHKQDELEPDELEEDQLLPSDTDSEFAPTPIKKKKCQALQRYEHRRPDEISQEELDMVAEGVKDKVYNQEFVS